MTDSGIEWINRDSTSANEDLIGLEIGYFHIGPDLQHLRPTEPRQHHRSATRYDASLTLTRLWFPIPTYWDSSSHAHNSHFSSFFLSFFLYLLVGLLGFNFKWPNDCSLQSLVLFWETCHWFEPHSADLLPRANSYAFLSSSPNQLFKKKIISFFFSFSKKNNNKLFFPLIFFDGPLNYLLFLNYLL